MEKIHDPLPGPGNGPVGEPAEQRPLDLTARRLAEQAKYEALYQQPGYGDGNHGRGAVSIVVNLNPTLTLDFGCGSNRFVESLREHGMEALGLDFAHPFADLNREMYETGLDDGVADCITSFDALEHLLPEDVPVTLDEMRRVATPGGHYVFSICYRQSTAKGVNGELLHPTVRPRPWWIQQIKRVATVEGDGIYLTGTFKE